MTMTAKTTQISVTGIGLVSSVGIGMPAFRQALQLPASQLSASDDTKKFAGPLLPEQASRHLIDFDARDYLGKKGVSALDRTTQLAIIATGLSLTDAQIELTPENQQSIGVVLGTATGSIKSIADFTQSTYLAKPPYMVSAMEFPNTVMNCAAGQCAIWHKLKGVNSTLCAGHLSGLAALRYAQMMLRLNYADTLIAGAVEEYCDFTAWAHHTHAQQNDIPPLGEGCAMFSLVKTDPKQQSLATLLAVHLQTFTAVSKQPTDWAADFEQCILNACRKADIAPAEIDFWSGQQSGPKALDDMERQTIEKIIPHHQSLNIVDHIGQTYSAEAAFQLAAMLATGQSGIGLVTSLSSHGMMGCALFRLHGASS